jgi:hypothetical protein
MEALKNDQGYRAALALPENQTMDAQARLAAQFGKPEVAASLYNQQEARAARAQQAADTLEQRRQQFETTAAQRARDAELLHETRLSRLQNETQRNEEIARHNSVLEGLTKWKAEQDHELKRYTAGINAQLRQQGFELARNGQQIQLSRLDMAKEQKTSRDTQQLSAALEKANLPEADAVLGAVETAITKRKDLAEYLSGPKSVLPDLAVDPEIRAGRQAFQKLFNITLKNRSGAAVTIPEFERLKSEFGSGAFKTADQLASALEQARNILSKHYASVASGFGKDVLDRYNENVRQFGGRVVLEGKPQGPARVSSDADYNALPKGAEYMAPDGSLRRKQ